jgi:hypothetical protein
MEFLESASRRTFTAVVLLLCLAITATAQLNRPGVGGWVELGDSHVDGHNDHDKINVRDHGPFHALRLHVRGSAVEFDHLLVHFQNGETQNLRASFAVRDGSNSPTIDLKGNQRNVDSVELWYKRGNWGSKPQVTLFGRR